MDLQSTKSRSKSIWFVVYLAGCVAIFSRPVGELFRLALSADVYSHILVIPWISVALIYLKRHAIFKFGPEGGTSKLAVAFFAAGVFLTAFTRWWAGSGSSEVSLALTILGLVLLIWAGFAGFHGRRAFRAALFPLLFLLLMLPPPAVVLDGVIVWLQHGSATLTGWIFYLTGTPAVRDGMFFAVPGVIIEITRECSGIRSTIATLITCLLAGYLILQGTRNRAVLLLVAVPVVILKNGIRISTLTLLAVHVDPAFLDGRLHHDGGVVFFLTGLALLLPVLWGLHRTEAGPADMRVSQTPVGPPAQPAC